MTLNVKITATMAALWASAGFAQTTNSEQALAEIQDYARQSLNLDTMPVFQGYDPLTRTARFESDMELPVYIPKAALLPDADPIATGLTRALNDQLSDPEGFLDKYNAATQSLGGLGYLPGNLTYRPDAPKLQPNYLRDVLNLPTGTPITQSGWVIEGFDGQPLAFPVEIDGDGTIRHVNNPILPGYDDIVRNITNLAFNEGLSQYHAMSVSSENGSACIYDCLLQTVAILVNGRLKGSGVLVHNRFVLTAKHVLTITNAVGFSADQIKIMNGPNNRDQTSLLRESEKIVPIADFDLALIKLKEPFQSPASIASLLATQTTTAPIMSLEEVDFDDVTFAAAGFGGGQVTSEAGKLTQELFDGTRRYNLFSMAEECNDCEAYEFLLETAPYQNGTRPFSCGIDSGSPALIRGAENNRLAVAGILTEALNPPTGDLRCATTIKFLNLTHPDIAIALREALTDELGLSAKEISAIFTDTPPMRAVMKRFAALL